MSYLVCYTMCMMIKKATYTLWNGSQMIATYPHTREGMDAAMEKAHSLYVGGYGTLTLYSIVGMTSCGSLPLGRMTPLSVV